MEWRGREGEGRTGGDEDERDMERVKVKGEGMEQGEVGGGACTWTYNMYELVLLISHTTRSLSCNLHRYIPDCLWCMFGLAIYTLVIRFMVNSCPNFATPDNASLSCVTHLPLPLDCSTPQSMYAHVHGLGLSHHCGVPRHQGF